MLCDTEGPRQCLPPSSLPGSLVNFFVTHPGGVSLPMSA